MQALLLAAGIGVRLRPITSRIPKCLVPLNNRPLLDIWLKRMKDNNFSPVFLNTYYLADQVKNFIKASPYKKFVSIIDEVELCGTAGTLFSVQNRLIKNEPLLMLHADNLSMFCIEDFIAAHNARPESCDMTMMLFHTDAPNTCGIVGIDNRGVMVAYEEKPHESQSNLANAAIFILEYSLIKELSEKYPLAKDFCQEILPKLIGRVNTYKNNVYHRDIGSIQSYEMAINDMAKNRDSWKTFL
ncbi:nucleotidyltransferase family protein [Polynucleobacter sp. MWH-UH23A]|uniref:nucleotidyltransferase family protein n=1 Tax=Polynucleobacter sp. MWH-UH23A TaxID=1855613 RepID=UPI00336504AD